MAFVKIPTGAGKYAYFQEGAAGLEAITNPGTLQGLQSGSIQATEQPTIAGGANRFSAIPQQTPRTLDGFQSTPPSAPQRSLGTVSDFQPQAGPAQVPLGERLMNMLLQAQRTGTSKFQTASLNLQDQQADRVFKTDPGLIGASPSQQQQARGADVSAIQPSINAAEQLGQTFGEQLGSFGDQVKTVQSYLKQESDRQNQEREQAQNDIYNAITAFGPRFNEVVGKDVLKLAGWTDEAVTAAKEKLTSQELFKQRGEGFTLGKDEIRYDAQNNAVAYGPGAGGGGAGTGVPSGTVYDFNNPDVIKNLPVSELTKAVISGTGAIKDFTPTDKAKIITEMYAVGYNPNMEIIDSLDKLVTLWQAVPDKWKGHVQGRAAEFLPKDTNDAAVTAFVSAKNVLTRKVARLNDVGVLSDQDVKSYNDSMPSLVTTDVTAVQGAVQGISTAQGLNTEKRIRVKIGDQTGTVLESEFDPNTMQKL